MASEQQGAETAKEQETAISFAEFLEKVPPNESRVISDIAARKSSPHGGTYYEFSPPQLTLHCTRDSCNGLRFFRHMSGEAPVGAITDVYMTYVCGNCRTLLKTFAIRVTSDKSAATGRCTKFGESPVFGVPTPPRLLRLFGDEKHLFLKGRRCENQGLGIGAFGYYRRVVERHKDQIFDEIIRVSERVGAPSQMVDALKAAKQETQFTKALASVKDAIPQVLLIGGHNPLTLLHSALSSGLHEQDDARCLELAQDVRVVMAELAERMGQALKDEAELTTAVSRLLRARDEKA